MTFKVMIAREIRMDEMKKIWQEQEEHINNGTGQQSKHTADMRENANE